MNPNRRAEVKTKIDQLLSVHSIDDANYPMWVSNTIVVLKKNNNIKVYTDFTNLNKAYLMHPFLMPRICDLVDETVRDERMSFLNTFLGYN